MVENLTLSPAALALLEMLEQQAGVAFEVVHLGLAPVRRSPSSDLAQRMDEAEVTEEVLKALRTGEVRFGHLPGVAFSVFPLRRARETVGCLIASHQSPRDQSVPVSVRRTIEEAGAVARGILESDLLVHGQLVTAQAVTRRLHATLRFLGQLGTYESDRDVMHAVLHAATVWFDLDCRIYERRPDGRFVLSVSLPGVELGAGHHFDADRAAHLVAGRRFPPAGDLDDLGLAGRKDEVLVLAVGIGEPAWLILLAGNLDSQVELTFGAIARVLTADLQARELARIERWQARLTELLARARATPDSTLNQLFEELVREAGAKGGRVGLTDRSGRRRTLAAIGSADAHEPVHMGPQRAMDEAREIVVTAALMPETSIHLELSGTDPVGPEVSAVAHTWVKALRPWIAEVAREEPARPRHLEADEEATLFERRIQEEVERAKRFNLGLGLVLIGPGDAPMLEASAAYDAVAAAVRPELRASDLLGRLHVGVAVVLVHAGAEGADSVTARLNARLSAIAAELPGRVQLGRAMFSPDCASADDLIAHARRASRAISPVH
jgi:hypothetical protein